MAGAHVLARGGVDDGQAHGRSVGGGGGGDNDHRRVVVVGHGLGGVHGLAAADAHHHVGVQSLGQTGAAEDLLLGALAAELLALDLAVAAGVQGLEALLVVGEEEHVNEEEHPAAVDLGMGFHVLQLIAALDVAAGGAPGAGGMLQHGHGNDLLIM